MGYIGNQQTEGYSQVPPKQDLTGATGTSLTLTHAVASAEGIDLFINNVRQEPTTAYSVGADGVTVTLTGSVVATDDIYVVYNSLARQTSTHPSNQALQATSGTFSGDFTVDTNTLYVDSTNNRVGVGTASPSELVELNVGSGNLVQKFNGATATFGIRNQSDGSFGHFDYTNSRWLDLRDYSSDNYQVFTSGSARMTIDSSGRVTMPTQPSFHAYLASNQAVSSGGQQVNFDTTRHNVGSVFNTSNSRFTVPVTGLYQINTNVSVTSGVQFELQLTVNGAVKVGCYGSTNQNGSNGWGISTVLSLTANDYLTVITYSGSGRTYAGRSDGFCSFSGHLLG